MAVVVAATGWYGWFWIVCPFALVAGLLLQRQTSKRRDIDLDVEVGVGEPHTVHFAWNAYKAVARIAVDGVQVRADGVRVPKWGPTTHWEYKVPVGEAEKHSVTFVRIKKYLFGLNRKQAVVAYIDNEVLATQAVASVTPE